MMMVAARKKMMVFDKGRRRSWVAEDAGARCGLRAKEDEIGVYDRVWVINVLSVLVQGFVVYAVLSYLVGSADLDLHVKVVSVHSETVPWEDTHFINGDNNSMDVVSDSMSVGSNILNANQLKNKQGAEPASRVKLNVLGETVDDASVNTTSIGSYLTAVLD
jgi:hypothetical protein